jgi:two-component system CheB/CheR fusion protein
VPDEPPDEDFEDLLVFLRESRGVDFTGYKRTSLRRLVGRRMRAVGVDDVRTYLDQLEVEQHEVRALFDSLLINVTAFFRDPPAWEALRTEHLPRLLSTMQPEEPVRAWSAACASGEEAYSLAVLLHEQLGDEAFRRRVKIYATDVDEDALSTARAGRYPTSALGLLTDEQRSTYFVQEDGVHVFRPDLRPNIIFGRHDLLADAPISRVSLLVCRNVLMYFTAETQARILERFAFALQERGLLVLGRAEMLLTYSELFTPADLPNRIFRTVGRPVGARSFGFGPAALARQAVSRKVTVAAFASAPDAQVVLDAETRVALVNDTAQRQLGVLAEDVGRLFAELPLSRRPVDLRVAVAEVLDTGEPANVQDVRWPRATSDDQWWDVRISPLPGSDGPLGVTLHYVDVTRYHQLTEQLTRAHSELETTNEELHSTNEELETMNEELQSTNEELQTVNDELRERTGEVGEVNAFLESVLGGLSTAVAVVDTDLQVMVWSARCEQLWGLRAFEVEGRSLMGLDGGLPVERLATTARAVLRSGISQDADTTVSVNRLGQSMLVRTAASPLRDRAGQVRGAILTMEEHALESRPAD